MASKEQQLRNREIRLRRLEKEFETLQRRHGISRSKTDQSALRSVERRLERERAAYEKMKKEVEGEDTPASDEGDDAASPSEENGEE